MNGNEGGMLTASRRLYSDHYDEDDEAMVMSQVRWWKTVKNQTWLNKKVSITLKH